jgi:hypothetical protein
MSEAGCEVKCEMRTPSPSGARAARLHGREGRDVPVLGRVRVGGSRSRLRFCGKKGGKVKRGDGGEEREYGISAVDHSVFELKR